MWHHLHGHAHCLLSQKAQSDADEVYAQYLEARRLEEGFALIESLGHFTEYAPFYTSHILPHDTRLMYGSGTLPNYCILHPGSEPLLSYHGIANLQIRLGTGHWALPRGDVAGTDFSGNRRRF